MDAVRRQFETNVFGLLRHDPARAARHARGGAGKIVNVSSMGGRLTFPGGGAYHATKYAVEAMSDALRMEVARFGIDVICIEPGLIRTEFGATAARRRAPRTTGPYADVQRRRGASPPREVYTGPLSRLGGDADDVARGDREGAAREAPRADPGAGHPLGAALHGPARGCCPTARGIAWSRPRVPAQRSHDAPFLEALRRASGFRRASPLKRPAR